MLIRKREVFMIGLIFLIIGFMLGMLIGVYKTLNQCIEIGIKILKLNKIEINVNKEIILEAITSHKGALESWLNITE